MKWMIPFLLLMAGVALPAAARGAGPETGSADGGQRINVWLVTFGPGEAVWERFGHDAIWIHDAAAGTDKVYNYGMFDFEVAHFYRNFIMGTMHYWMAAFPMEDTVRFYRSIGRAIWVQRLNFSQAQAKRLQAFLEWNAEPANKYYHYNYYTDNCATRVRDALDRALGGQIKAQTGEVSSGETYRDFTRRDLVDFPAIYTALEFVLGQPVDRPLTQWQRMYLPMQTREIVRGLKVRNADGRLVPLVMQEATLNTGVWPMPPEVTPHWWGRYLATGVGLGIVFVLLGLAAGWEGRHRRARRSAAIILGLLGVFWMLLLGFAGWFLLWGERFTNNPAIFRNENLLHFSPLAILGVVLVPGLLGRRRWAMWPGRILLILLVAGGGFGLLIKALPWFHQSNWTMIALTLPANIGLLAAVGRRGRPADLSPNDAIPIPSVREADST